jgi:phospholipid/cholesterol/gamma-HCH transport system substrate-binding protein
VSPQTLRFRLGLFTIACLTLLVGLAIMFGSMPTLFRSGHVHTLCFTDAPGVAVGTPVRRSGVRVGEVTAVALDADSGEVRVKVRIDRSYTLRRNDRPTLVQSLIGGDASIDLIPAGKEGEPVDRSPVPPGESVVGTRPVTVTGLMSRASEVVPATQDTLMDLRRSLQRFEKVGPLVEETLREYRDLAKASREAVPELRRTNEEIGKLASAARQAAPQVGGAGDGLSELAKSVSEAVPEFRQTNKQVQGTFASWTKAGDRVESVVSTNEKKLAKAVDGLNTGLDRLNRLLSDDNLNNLTTTLKNVKSGSDDLQKAAGGTEALVADTRAAVKKINDAVAKADDTFKNAADATRPFADRSDRIMKNLDESADKLNKTLTDVRELLKAIEENDGTVQKLLKDPSLYNHLDELLCGIIRQLPRVERILKDVELFADKIARHPESLGVGGVVTPGSGLKK